MTTQFKPGNVVEWTCTCDQCRALRMVPLSCRIVKLCEVASQKDRSTPIPGAELEMLGLDGKPMKANPWRNEFAPLADLTLVEGARP